MMFICSRYRSTFAFPLCRTCCIKKNRQIGSCSHTPEERVLTSVWTSMELSKALTLGYKITSIYEIWHFPQQDTEIFRNYIRTFFAIKVQAGGYPSWCKTDEEKASYIQQFQEVSEALPRRSPPPGFARPSPGEKGGRGVLHSSV